MRKAKRRRKNGGVIMSPDITVSGGGGRVGRRQTLQTIQEPLRRCSGSATSSRESKMTELLLRSEKREHHRLKVALAGALGFATYEVGSGRAQRIVRQERLGGIFNELRKF